jgi:hypothetical protein
VTTPTYPTNRIIDLAGGVTQPELANISSFTWFLESGPAGFVDSSTSTLQTTTYPFGGSPTRVSGTYTFKLRVCNWCNLCTNATTTSVTLDCPYSFTVAARATPTTSTWSKDHFSRIEVDGVGSNLGGLDPTTPTVTWRFLSAPVDSTYARTLVTNSSTVSSIVGTVVTADNDTFKSIVTTTENDTTATNIEYYSTLINNQATIYHSRLVSIPICLVPTLCN